MRISDYSKFLDRQSSVYIRVFIATQRQLVPDFIMSKQFTAVDNALVFFFGKSAVNYLQRAVRIVFARFVKRIYPCDLLFARIRVDVCVREISGININIRKPFFKASISLSSNPYVDTSLISDREVLS